MSEPFYEIAITGDTFDQLRNEMSTHFIPNGILFGAKAHSELPLLEGKFLGNGTVFVCQNKTCQLPVDNIEAALGQMK